MFAVGSDGVAYETVSADSGECWAGWTSRQGRDLRHLAAGTNRDGRLELFALGADGVAYHKWQAVPRGAWGEWASLEGHDLRHVAAVSNQDGRLELFALGADGAVYHRWQTAPGAAWGAWSGLQGHDLRKLATAINRDGRLELFALGADGAVYHRWQATPNGDWNDWSGLQGHGLRDIAAATNADGRLELFAIGADGIAYHRWQVTANGGWGEWASLGGTNLRMISATRAKDGRLEVAAVDGGSIVKRIRQQTANGNWGDWMSSPDCVEAAVSPSPELLAAYWAPVLSQDTDSHNTRADYLTRFDFDGHGNWSSKDNWDHLDEFALPANVYFWVIETGHHYFIGYAFFHPRDWSSSGGPLAEHNNDLEAIVLAVAKGAAGTFGKFLAMVTVAHNDFYSFTDSDTPAASPWYVQVEPSRFVGEREEDIDGDVDFVVDGFGLHPVVYLEAEGHGAYGAPGAGFGVDDYAPIFGDENVVDWRSADFNGIVAPPRSGGGGQAYDVGSWGDGVIYHYEGTADVPAGPGQTSNDSLPHDWQVIGYQLLEIKPLWERRNDYVCVGENERSFESDGNFVGSGAQAPWGLDDGTDSVPRGWIFTTPMFLFDRYFTGLGGSLWPLGGSPVRRSYEPSIAICNAG